MFAVKFYASCFDSRGNSIGKKLLRLDWEKATYWLLSMLANSLEHYADFSQLNPGLQGEHLTSQLSWVTAWPLVICVCPALLVDELFLCSMPHL